MSGDAARAPEFCWGVLVARALHPVDVQVIEAFQWIDQPLSAGDLTELFDGKPSRAVMGRRMQRLAKVDALELDERLTAGDVTDVRYRLALELPADDR